MEQQEIVDVPVFADQTVEQVDQNTGVTTGTDATESDNSGQDATDAGKSGQQHAGASSFPKEAIDEISKLRSRSRAAEDAKIRAEAERDFLMKEREQKPVPIRNAEPRPENFTDDDQYRSAYTKWIVDTTVEERLAKERADTDQRSKVNRFTERQKKLAEAVPDYSEVFRAAPISELMANEILSSEVGPEVTDYLGRNRDEALGIYSLQDAKAVARAIGRIEAKIELRTPPPAGARPPPPFKPVTGSSGVSKSLEDMPMEEYEAFLVKQKVVRGI